MTTAPSGEAGALTVATTTGALGTYLVDGKGMTLYMFTPDTGGASTCYDKCAAVWPPLVGTVTAGPGLDAAKLTTTTRKDGAVQAVYGGWPLYYFAQDKAAGDTLGQNVNTKWYVLGADGTPITTAP